MWQTECTICGKLNEGEPKRCNRCGSNLDIYGHKFHLQTGITSEDIEHAGLFYIMLNSQYDLSDPKKIEKSISSFSKSLKNSRYVTSVHNEKIKELIDNEGRHYIAIYFDMPIYRLSYKDADYQVMDGQKILDAIINSPTLDGIIINPEDTVDSSTKVLDFFIAREDILKTLKIKGTEPIVKYANDGINKDFFVHNMVEEIINNLGTVEKTGIKNQPISEYYYGTIGKLIKDTYLSESTIDPEEEDNYIKSIIDAVVDKICKG